jgi:sortase A
MFTWSLACRQMATLAQADASAGPGRASQGRPPLGMTRRLVREIGLALITVGVVVLAFATYQLFGTTLAEQKSQTRLQHSFAAALAHNERLARSTPTTTTPGGARGSGGGSRRRHPGARPSGGDNPTVGAPGSISPSVPAGAALDHMVIPKIGVNKYVVEGTAAGDLAEGPGHYIGTPLPGQRGNAAIAGHRTTYGAPFYRLNKLSVGDRIYLTSTSGRIFVYRVVATEVVNPSDTAVLDATTHTVLTLTTCNPPFSATSRLVVVADLVGRPLPPVTTSPPPTGKAAGKAKTSKPKGTTATSKTAGGTPSTVAAAPAGTAPNAAPAATLGAGNGNGWTPASAYGAAFVVLWIGARLAINRTRRWARLGAVVIGVLVSAVPLWFGFENVVRLLPANI